MGTQKQSVGFTIIEVMLFLAVSGALAVAVLTTSTIGINNQRYQDAVTSFKSLVQEEFINTTRVVNTRQGAGVCPLDPAAGTAVPGATECIIIGRLMTVAQDGAITRSNLIGKGTTTSEKDIEAIKAYDIDIDSSSEQTSRMSWGTTLSRNQSAQSLSIVIFRSPSSGNTLAFVKQNSLITSKVALRQFMDDTAVFKNNISQSVCINPAGLTIAQMQGVIISPYAAGPAGVQQRVVDEGTECL
jgi:type II secretory pathway pseudopilin PulG